MMKTTLLGTLLKESADCGGSEAGVAVRTLARVASASLKCICMSAAVLATAKRVAGGMTEEDRMAVLAEIDPERMGFPLWIEYETPRRVLGEFREGWLARHDVGHLILSRYAETDEHVRADHEIWRIGPRLGGGWTVEVKGVRDSHRSEAEQMGFEFLALLAVATAPELTTAKSAPLPDRLPRGVHAPKTIDDVRLTPQWADVDGSGAPKLPREARPERVLDEVLDGLTVIEGMILSGSLCHGSFAKARTCLEDVRGMRMTLAEHAEPFVLTPDMAEAVAALAAEERAGMDRARERLSLPFPLTWIEWSGTGCGLPGRRFAIALKAVDSDVRGDAGGFVFTLPERWLVPNQLARLPLAMFRLNIKDASRPLFELDPDRRTADFAVEQVNPDLFGRFLLAMLTFINQPKIVDLRADSHQAPARARTDRLRAERRLAPLRAVREIHLTIGGPEAVGHVQDGGTGERAETMPLHQVRAFWCYKLGRLEFVRPHWCGDERNGVSRRRYIVGLGGGGDGAAASLRC